MHIVPVDDSIVHDTSDIEDCICDPTVSFVKTDKGALSWVITHKVLDVIEKREFDV